MHKLNSKIFLLFLFLFFIQILNAIPRFRFQVYSTKDGLPQKRISGILQDKKGFIWLSSWNGLSRFDGYSFSNYKKSADNPNIPSNSRLRLIKEDSNNNIWCLSYDRRAYLFNTNNYCYNDVLARIEKEKNKQFFVKNIVPVSNNKVWLICEKGISFCVINADDDKRMEVIQYNESKNDDIYNIFEDKKGNIWILTSKGVSVIGDFKIEDQNPYSLYGIQDNSILLSSIEGNISIFDIKNNELRKLKSPQNITDILQIIPVYDGMYVIVTNQSLWKFNPQSNSFQSYDIQLTDHKVKFNNFYTESNDILWLFTNSTYAIRVNLKTGESKNVSIVDNMSNTSADYRLPSLHKDKNGDVWIITPDGYLAYYNAPKGEFTKILESSDGYKFSSNQFRERIFIDNQDNLWIPTINGIFKITVFPRALHHTQHDTNYDTRAIFIDKNENLWTGTKAGVVRIYDKDRVFKGFLNSSGIISNEEVKFSESGVYSIIEDVSNNIWIGTKGSGLFCLSSINSKSNQFKVKSYKNEKSDPYSLSGDNIYSIYEDSKHQIWIGCYGTGLDLMTTDSKGNTRFINANNELKNYPLFKYSFIRCISEANSDVMLIGTTEGLLTFSLNSNNIQDIHFYENHSDKNRLNSMRGNDVMCIFNTHDKATYLATSDGGINKINCKNLLSDSISFQFIKLGEHASNPELFQSLIEDKDFNIWVVSEDALVKYSPSIQSSEIYRRSSFISNNYYSEAIPALDSKGDLIIGTEMGILDINPHMMKKATYAPPIVFTDINIPGKPMSNVGTNQELNLTPSQRSFSLNFAALDYINANEINYAYRLLGMEKEWNYIGKSRSVSYANLPHGEYTFQIMSTNSDGVWMDNITELKINVLPKFSETFWAKILFALVLIFILGFAGFIIMYIYKLKYKVRFEQQLTEVKLHFFTDISHELRTPLTLISGPVTEVLKQEDLSTTSREYLNVVNNNVTRMSRLVNEILDIRKIQNEKMRLIIENTNLGELINSVMQNFEILKREKQINFNFETSTSPMFCWIDKDKFEKILFNLISNAFKYTPNGKSIRIKLTENDKYIYLSVIDEGIGISSDKFDSIFDRFESFAPISTTQASSGIGLSLVKELTNMHHATISLDSRKNEGSEFKIILLKGKTHFKEDGLVDFLLTDTDHNNTDVVELDSNEKNENLGSIRLLIVEDNDELRKFLSTILRSTYDIIEAKDGVEGLKMAKDEIPDFIITDIAMPHMDGLSMIKLIKEDQDTCHIPIIVLSAKSSLDDQLHGLDYGIDDYIIKPFSAEYLKTKIKTIIDQRKQLQEYYTNEISKDVHQKDLIEEPQIKLIDQDFIDRLTHIMDENLDNSELNVDDLASSMNFSRSVFYRKMISIMGISPVDFMRKTRIARAKELINSQQYTLSQVAYMTGFSDPKYFGKIFKRETGMNPSEFN